MIKMFHANQSKKKKYCIKSPYFECESSNLVIYITFPEDFYLILIKMYQVGRADNVNCLHRR